MFVSIVGVILQRRQNLASMSLWGLTEILKSYSKSNRIKFNGGDSKEVKMEQTIFKESGEELLLRRFNQPLSVEEIVHYLRTVSDQLQEMLERYYQATKPY